MRERARPLEFLSFEINRSWHERCSARPHERRQLRPLFADPFARVIANQLLRSAWSVSANYRVTKHAKSSADFTAKMAIVAEEGEECAMWLDALRDLSLLDAGSADELRREANELVSIAVASIKTARRNAR